MTNAARREQQTFKLSSLTLSVYLPTLLFSIGEGAVLPIIPLFARGRGARWAMRGAMAVLPIKEEGPSCMSRGGMAWCGADRRKRLKGP
jgi:hypothetical protein